MPLQNENLYLDFPVSRHYDTATLRQYDTGTKKNMKKKFINEFFLVSRSSMLKFLIDVYQPNNDEVFIFLTFFVPLQKLYLLDIPKVSSVTTL